jgi:hypothetical protein
MDDWGGYHRCRQPKVSDDTTGHWVCVVFNDKTRCAKPTILCRNTDWRPRVAGDEYRKFFLMGPRRRITFTASEALDMIKDEGLQTFGRAMTAGLQSGLRID